MGKQHQAFPPVIQSGDLERQAYEACSQDRSVMPREVCPAPTETEGKTRWEALSPSSPLSPPEARLPFRWHNLVQERVPTGIQPQRVQVVATVPPHPSECVTVSF